MKCPYCPTAARRLSMSDTLTEEQWAAIDELLFARNPLWAVRTLRQITGLGLNAAAELMHARYSKLRQEHPDRFACSHDEYWQGWYS